jgi:hypothetical protein
MSRIDNAFAMELAAPSPDEMARIKKYVKNNQNLSS